MPHFTSKSLVVCFDGTAGEFSAQNSNVVKLFGLLRKDDEDKQVCYYQSGIGTYTNPGIISPFIKWVATIADLAAAWYLDHHVMGGYQFLMQNYREGDRISIFGFSRGAYTARALAAMLYSVGLLPRDNIEQVSFAYKTYAKTGAAAEQAATLFKNTFSRTVTIDFVGCWDTVASTGVLYSRTLPFTSSNTIIKTFRHALALDEHRAKFQANLWHRPAPSRQATRMDPQHASPIEGKDSPKVVLTPLPGETPRAVTLPPTNVLEVWFAGGHSDIGGGNQVDAVSVCLSDITLRWMVREVIAANAGVLFDPVALETAGIPLELIHEQLARNSTVGTVGDRDTTVGGFSVKGDPPLSADANLGDSDVTKQKDAQDALTVLTDALQATKVWWLLEIIPLPCSWQDDKDVWHRAWRWNLGRGRVIYQEKPNFYITVQQRIQNQASKYKPRATYSGEPNWIS